MSENDGEDGFAIISEKGGGVHENFGPGEHTWIVPKTAVYVITICGGAGADGGEAGEMKTFEKELKKDNPIQLTVGKGGVSENT